MCPAVYHILTIISLQGGTSIAGTDLSDLDYLMGQEYTDLVGVHEIADAASVSSASILSVIDWDQVENLIADVND